MDAVNSFKGVWELIEFFRLANGAKTNCRSSNLQKIQILYWLSVLNWSTEILLHGKRNHRSNFAELAHLKYMYWFQVSVLIRVSTGMQYEVEKISVWILQSWMESISITIRIPVLESEYQYSMLRTTVYENANTIGGWLGVRCNCYIFVKPPHSLTSFCLTSLSPSRKIRGP